MKPLFSSCRVRLSKRGYHVILLVTLLGAIVTVGAFSFAPLAHAAVVASPGPNTSVVRIVTNRAHSVLVKEISSPLPLPKCYNTPATIRGLEGKVELIGYSNLNCSGTHLCAVIKSIPPSSSYIIRFC